MNDLQAAEQAIDQFTGVIPIGFRNAILMAIRAYHGTKGPHDHAPTNILEEAMTLTAGKRKEDYGHPLDDFTKTAGMWEQVLGVAVTPEQMALCMILVKVARLTHSYKRDSLVDIAGYANTIQMLVDERERRKPPIPDATKITVPGKE